MLAIGGTIGAGIFQGSAETIQLAGPGVVFAYLFAGIILFFVMSSLAEMASAFPGVELRGLIHKGCGHRLSFISGWLYWINWVIVIAVEVVAAGTFLHYWFTSVPVWMLSMICAIGILVMNLFSVRMFGEVEFWLSTMKVVTLIVFVFLGSYLLFWSGIGETPPPGLTNYTEAGGFFPKGILGVLASFVVVIFSFGGSEMIGLTLSEVKESHKVLPKVLRGVIVRITLFYLFPILIIVGLIPWDQVGSGQSPFVQVLSEVGLPSAASVMNFILLTAMLSAANSGMYATSRLLYSMAQDGAAPKVFSKLSKTKVPIYGLFISSLFLFFGAWLSFVAPENVFNYLMGIPGFTVLLMWLAIVTSQLRLRKQYEHKDTYQLSFYPYSSWLTIIVLLAILLTMILTSSNVIQVIIVFLIVSTLGITSFFIKIK